jgi:hypothetical protein
MTGSTPLPFDVNQVAADLGQALEDGVYIAIGLGILGFQRAQVRRVELTRQLEMWWGQLGGLGDTPGDGPPDPFDRSGFIGPLGDLAERIDEALAPARERGRQLIGSSPALTEDQLETARLQLTQLVRTVDDRVKPVRQQLDEQVDLIEQYLPPAARSLVQALRAATAEPEQRLRGAMGLD